MLINEWQMPNYWPHTILYTENRIPNNINNDKININFERDALIDLNLYYVLMEKYLNNRNHQPVNELPNMEYVWFHLNEIQKRSDNPSINLIKNVYELDFNNRIWGSIRNFIINCFVKFHNLICD